jgi:hypothetical protein
MFEVKRLSWNINIVPNWDLVKNYLWGSCTLVARGNVPPTPGGAQYTPYIVCQSRLLPVSDLNGAPRIWAYNLRQFIARRCICLSARVRLSVFVSVVITLLLTSNAWGGGVVGEKGSCYSSGGYLIWPEAVQPVYFLMTWR